MISIFALQVGIFGLIQMLFSSHMIQFFISIEMIVIALFSVLIEYLAIHPQAHAAWGSTTLMLLIFCGAELALGLSLLVYIVQNRQTQILASLDMPKG